VSEEQRSVKGNRPSCAAGGSDEDSEVNSEIQLRRSMNVMIFAERVKLGLPLFPEKEEKERKQ